MPVPTTLASLSTTAASNSPGGGENPFPDLDDHIRAGYAFDAQNRDAITAKLDASAVSAYMLTVLNDADAPTARATLGAVGLTGDQTVAGVKTFSSAPVSSAAAANANELLRKGEADTALALKVSTSAFTGMNQSLTGNGFQIFPGGLIVQWGQSAPINGDASVTVTFPTAFPNTCFTVVATVVNSSAGIDNGTAVISFSTTQTVLARTFISGTSTETNPINWIAFGR